MSKIKLIMSITIAIGIITPAYYYIKVICSEIGLMERFPDVPHDIVIKAHRQIFFETLRGEHPEAFARDDADRVGGELDQIFLKKVAQLTAN